MMSFFIGLNQTVTYLPRSVNLSDYEVAATDCYLPVHQLYSGNNFEVLVSDNAGLSYDHRILINVSPAQIWSQLLSEMTEKLSEYIDMNVTEQGTISIRTLSENIFVKLTRSLARVLGLQGQNITHVGQLGISPVNTELLFQRVIVSSSIANASPCNGRYLPVVYSGHPTPAQIFPNYVKTVAGDHYFIALQFTNIFGEQLNVRDGCFNLLLHFKRS